jgi:hypothetical protein
MPTECNPELFGFSPVEGRKVVAAFDAGAITSRSAQHLGHGWLRDAWADTTTPHGRLMLTVRGGWLNLSGS